MTTINLDSFNVYIILAVNGLFTGLGCAVGTYIAQRHIISIPERIRKRLKILKHKNKKIKKI